MTTLHTINLKGIIYFLGYKVVTTDLKSLGLRDNPNIIQYKVNEWCFLPEEEIEEGKGDWGGIWVARTLSNAKGVIKSINRTKNPFSTRIFEAALDQILYFNDYRIKTNGVMLFEEIIYSKYLNRKL